MSIGLHRYYGAGYSHFITTSCYQRRPLLDSATDRDLFLEVLEQTRRCYHFVVVGYVVMPEHVHLLLSEPERANPSTVVQALKQGFAQRLLRRLEKEGNPHQQALWTKLLERRRVWQHRFYDFVVFSEHKRIEKLRYMHRNPVKRGLVSRTGGLDLEQFSPLCVRRGGNSSGKRAKQSGTNDKYAIVRLGKWLPHPARFSRGGN